MGFYPYLCYYMFLTPRKTLLPCAHMEEEVTPASWGARGGKRGKRHFCSHSV